MAPTPRKQLKGDVEKNLKIESICTLSAADIKRVLDARAKSPRTSIPSLASILKLDGEQVKLALKMDKVRKKIVFIPDNDDEDSKSSTAATLSAPTTPTSNTPSFDTFDELSQFDSNHSTSVATPKASTSSHHTDEDTKDGFDSHSDDNSNMEQNTIATHSTDRTQREKILEYFSNYDEQLRVANARIRDLQKVSENLKSEKTKLAKKNDNLKEDLKRNNDQVVALTKKNGELKRAFDAKEKSFGMVTEKAKSKQLANEADVTCIGCNKKMVFNFRELAFCSTECVRSVASKLKGAESLKAMPAPPRATEN